MPSRLGVKDVFVVKKFERPFPNNVHTATLSVNCIETELTFVSKPCATFILPRIKHFNICYRYTAQPMMDIHIIRG